MEIMEKHDCQQLNKRQCNKKKEETNTEREIFNFFETNPLHDKGNLFHGHMTQVQTYDCYFVDTVR